MTELPNMSQEHLLDHEKDLWAMGLQWVAGIDEAGRGPLAGPVVAAAVVFSPGQPLIEGIRDSKQLKPGERERLSAVILKTACAAGIGLVSERDIDELNILQATFLAMHRAVAGLELVPDYLLVDGKFGPAWEVPSRCIVKGDTRSMSVAAASIVAKNYRDKVMIDYHRQYPQYNFARHKGYATRHHLSAIRRHGLCPLHRRSFRPRGLMDLYCE
jgi:ribonuclease HII